MTPREDSIIIAAIKNSTKLLGEALFGALLAPFVVRLGSIVRA
jgi:hypothetical protein